MLVCEPINLGDHGLKRRLIITRVLLVLDHLLRRSYFSR